MIDFYRKTAGLHKRILLLAVHALFHPCAAHPCGPQSARDSTCTSSFGWELSCSCSCWCLRSIPFSFSPKPCGYTALLCVLWLSSTQLVLVRSAAAQRIPRSCWPVPTVHTQLHWSTTCFLVGCGRATPGELTPHPSQMLRSVHVHHITCDTCNST